MSDEQGTKDKEEERRKRIFASESSHWYNHDASPAHEVLKTKKRKGDPDEYRPANISDARKLGLLPSVTNLISKFSNKAGIEIWKRQILLDCIDMDLALDLYQAGMDEEKRDEIFKHIAAAADKETGRYAEIGTLVHACIERGIQMILKGTTPGAIVLMVASMVEGTGFDHTYSLISGTIQSLWNNSVIFTGCKVVQEKGFAFNVLLDDGLEFGMAGKVDILIEYSPDDVNLGKIPALPQFDSFRALARERAEKGLPTRLLIDFKTRKPNRLKSGKVSFPSYSSDIAQLAGYSEGAKYAAGFKPDACFNMLISSDSLSDLALDHTVELRPYSPGDIIRGMAVIRAMAAQWVAEENLTQADPYRPKIDDLI